jgi:hypothetical protein
MPRRMNILNHSITLATRGIVVYGTLAICQTIFITKMIVRSRPFFELENACPSEISNHFPNRKGTAHPRPFVKLKNDCPSINNISYLPPNLGVISSFFIKGYVFTSPILFLEYAKFSSWIEALPKYMLSSHMWRYIGEPFVFS